MKWWTCTQKHHNKFNNFLQFQCQCLKWVPLVLFPGRVQQPGHEVDHYTDMPLYAFMAWAGTTLLLSHKS